MERRSFKNTGVDISLLGFGIMRLPLKGDKPSDIDEEKALEMIDYAYDHGVNYFDTAYMYHDFASEPFIGKALSRYRRDSYHLATKMPPWELHKKEDQERIFDEQLKNCGVDYFDFYLMHSVSRATMPSLEKYGVYEFLKEQQKKGKLRYLGFSFHDSTQFLQEALDRYEVDLVQIQLNYHDWDAQDAKGLYELLYSRGIPAVIMEPLRGGTLASLSPDSVELLRQAAPERSTASWAIRFAAELPGVLTVLSGMSNMEQVRDNVATMKNFASLTPDEHDVIRRAVDIYRKKATIPCTSCRYCMPCPSGVDIPQSFAIYNLLKKEGKEQSYIMQYRNIGKGNQAADCIACGKCVEQCPQKIDIPGRMAEIAEAYASLIKKAKDTASR